MTLLVLRFAPYSASTRTCPSSKTSTTGIASFALYTIRSSINLTVMRSASTAVSLNPIYQVMVARRYQTPLRLTRMHILQLYEVLLIPSIVPTVRSFDSNEDLSIWISVPAFANRSVSYMSEPVSKESWLGRSL